MLDTNSLSEALADVLPVYDVQADDLVGQVLVPGMSAAEEVRIGSGFFSSESLAQIAPGLAAFIAGSEQPLRLLVSPEISATDLQAIDRGAREPQAVVDEATTRLFEGAALSASAVVAHTLECLSYLIAAGRLELRVVLMKEGIFHKKIWLLHGDAWCAIHGSSNVTKPGLLVNGEQMTVDRPWMDGPSAQRRVEMLLEQWNKHWENRYPNALTVALPDALRFIGKHHDDVPTVDDFWKAWRVDFDQGLAPELPPGSLRTGWRVWRQ